MFATRFVTPLLGILCTTTFLGGADATFRTPERRLRGYDDDGSPAEWKPLLIDQREVETGSLTEQPLPQQYYAIIEMALLETFNGLMDRLVHHATIRMMNDDDDDDDDDDEDDGQIKKWKMTITDQDLENYLKHNNRTQGIYYQWHQMSHSSMNALDVIDKKSFKTMVGQYASTHNLPGLKIKFTRRAEMHTLRVLNLLATQSMALGKVAAITDEGRRGRQLFFFGGDDDTSSSSTTEALIGFLLSPFSSFFAAFTNPFTLLCIVLKGATGNIIGLLTGCNLFGDVAQELLETGAQNGWDMTFMASPAYEMEGVPPQTNGPRYLTGSDIALVAEEMGFGSEIGVVPDDVLETVADFTSNVYASVLKAVIGGAEGTLNDIAATFLPQPLLG